MFKILFVAALIACVVAESDDHHAEIEKYYNNIGHDSYDLEFQTTNHIRQSAHGDKHGHVNGDFEWVDPHGEHIYVKYFADEYGYHPESKALPTPPPIPEYILKAIEYINSHPPYEEEQHHHHHDHHDDVHHHHHHYDDVHH